MKKRFLSALLLAIAGIILFITPALAILNPTNIWFGTKTPLKYAKCFENVLETGDMLFLGEGYVHYAATPTDYSPEQAFLFEVRTTDTTTVIISRPLASWGERPISIYLTPTQVTTLGLVSESAYWLRITGNPLIFAPLVEGTDMISYNLSLDDWIDQSLATETNNPLRDACIYIAENMQEEDAVTTYLYQTEGRQYLTPTGGNLFLEGIPSLNIFVSSLFQITTDIMTAETPDATGTYETTIKPIAMLGATTSRAIANIGEWFGVSQDMAAGIILMALMTMLCVWLYKKTQSGKVVLAIGVAATLPVGTYLGLSSLALLFIIVIFIVLLMGFYFLTRGSL